jgi:hypothetical protein
LRPAGVGDDDLERLAGVVGSIERDVEQRARVGEGQRRARLGDRRDGKGVEQVEDDVLEPGDETGGRDGDRARDGAVTFVELDVEEIVGDVEVVLHRTLLVHLGGRGRAQVVHGHGALVEPLAVFAGRNRRIVAQGGAGRGDRQRERNENEDDKGFRAHLARGSETH